MYQPHRRQHGFSLVELITVVAIIAILAAILLPAMARAKELTRRTMCATNQHQSWMAIQMYADEQDDMLPPGYRSNWPVGIFRHNTNYDLRTFLDGYLDYNIWICTTLGNAPMDDPGNTRFACYTPWYYFPGFPEPSFRGTGGAPTNLRSLSRFDDFPMIQDQVVDLTRVAQRNWRYNHGRGEIFYYGPDDPSLALRYYPLRSGLAGTNISYYDGHTEWVTGNRLEYIGNLAIPEPNAHIYSTMPDISVPLP